MQLTKYSLLTSISLIIRKYKGNYCYASQQRFLELLEEFHGIKIKVRALNKHLADLRKEGFIKSQKRSTRNEDGTLCLATSATCITIKGYYLLVAEGVDWCKGILYQLKKKYMTWFEKKEEEGKKGETLPCVSPVDALKEKINQAKAEGKTLYEKLLNART
jgi:hypothetical protein